MTIEHAIPRVVLSSLMIYHIGQIVECLAQSLSENLIFQLSLNPSPFGVKIWGTIMVRHCLLLNHPVAKIGCLLKFDCFHNYL
jgi:hypothetical protein